MDKNRILIVEDDDEINTLIKDVLSRRGYETTSAYSGTEALLCIENNKFDAIILDLMLPGISGESLIEKVRKVNKMPIIVASAKPDVEDRINVLKLGADDFLGKPFNINELVARVDSQIRRYTQYSSVIQENNIRYKNLILDRDSHNVKVNGHDINLTMREFAILALLLSNPKKVFTRANIFESVWESSFLGDENTVNVHISNIRNKIAEYDKDEYIHTVWGIGFKIN